MKNEGGKAEPISHFSNRSTFSLESTSMQLTFDEQIPGLSVKIVLGAVKLHFFKLQQNNIITPPNGLLIPSFLFHGGGGYGKKKSPSPTS